MVGFHFALGFARSVLPNAPCVPCVVMEFSYTFGHVTILILVC